VNGNSERTVETKSALGELNGENIQLVYLMFPGHESAYGS